MRFSLSRSKIEVCGICKNLDGLRRDGRETCRIRFFDITKSADGGCCTCGILRDECEFVVDTKMEDEIHITIVKDTENDGAYINEDTMKTVHFFA